jgi:glucose-1-phosphate cytidylyltransferase
MKVIVLAGGWGSRLGQMVDVVPKPMIRVGNKPMLWHIMKIYAHYGHNEFVIAMGVKSEIVKEYFINFEALNRNFTIDISKNKTTYHEDTFDSDWKVTLVDTGINTLKGGRIKRLEKYLEGDVHMLTYGDGVADIDINKLLDFHKSHNKIVTLTGVRPSSLFGELEEIDGRVVSFTEKPKAGKSFVNGGFMVFNKEMLDYLSSDEECDFEFGPLEELARKGQVMMYKHEGSWACMDHRRDVEHLNNLWNQQKAFWKVW